VIETWKGDIKTVSISAERVTEPQRRRSLVWRHKTPSLVSRSTKSNPRHAESEITDYDLDDQEVEPFDSRGGRRAEPEPPRIARRSGASRQ